MRLNNEKNSSEKSNKVSENFIKIEENSRVVFITEPINRTYAAKVSKLLLLYDEISNDPIKIFINSPGGEVYSGFFIYDSIRFIHSPVYIIGSGLVASAAAIIYLAVGKRYRFCFPHARFLLHQPLSGMKGTVTDLEIHAKELDNIKKLVSNIISNETGQSIEKVNDDIDRDYWLHAEDAKDYGLVNNIIHSKNELDTLFPTVKIKDAKGEKKAAPAAKPEKTSKTSTAKTASATKTTAKTKAKPAPASTKTTAKKGKSEKKT